MKFVWICFAIVACSKTQSPQPETGQGSQGGTPSSAKPLPQVDRGSSGGSAKAAKPQLGTPDDRAKTLISRGALCELSQGTLPLDCPERKAIADHAFEHQQSKETAETCASFLRDEDAKKRLLAAECLDRMTAIASTTQLVAMLDAIEAEKELAIAAQMAWAAKNMEAVTAKQESRVLALVKKYAAKPETAKVAGHLFDTLFPQYMIGRGPTPPQEAQQLAIESIEKGSPEMRLSSLNAARLLEDKSAACRAIGAAFNKEADRWFDLIDATIAIREPCQSIAAPMVEKILSEDSVWRLRPLIRFDRAFELEPALRKKVVSRAKSLRSKASSSDREDLDELIVAFSQPRKPTK